MPERRKARAYVALNSRRVKTAPTAENAAALAESQRTFAELTLEEHIRRVIDAAPPLSQEQADRLAALLRPSGGGGRAA